tara:strand:+ start:233 stop:1054 length:822 start_codon:yes stop_codon:yes gene_type:complete
MKNFPKTSTIDLENTHNGWLTIWLNRPDSKNALSEDMLDELLKVLSDLQKDKETRGVTFRGRGGIFCSGGDLKGFKKMTQAGNKAREIAYKMSLGAGDFFKMIHTLPQITISAVEGAAMAGGFGLACASDFIVATEESKMALTEVLIGLTPAQIAPYIIQRAGFQNTRQLMLLSKVIKGKEALKMGLIDFISKNEKEMNDQIENIQNSILKGGPNALRSTKKMIEAVRTLEQEKIIPLAADLFADCLVSNEGQEGFNSFLEKRKPKWAKDILS